MSGVEQEQFDNRLKRLKFRAWHRGTRESDIILGNFVEQNLDNFTAEDCSWFEQLFKEQEQEILEWITGKTIPPKKYQNEWMRKMQKLDFLPIDAKSDA